MIKIAESLEAVVKTAHDVLVKPTRGVHRGAGRHCKMPEEITDADILSGDPRRTIGWTHYGPGRDRCVVLSDVDAAKISACKPADCKDPVALSVAKTAISRGVVVTGLVADPIEKPTEVAERIR